MHIDSTLTLSVIIRVVGGSEFLERCIRALVAQTHERPIEIIVPYDAGVLGIDKIKAAFPEVIFVDIGLAEYDKESDRPAAAHERYDRRSARGMQIARGHIVAQVEDYTIPDPDWCEQVLAAHQASHGVIGGAVEHVGSGLLNWAVFFLDFARYQLPLHAGPAAYLTDINVSYKREVLKSVEALWQVRYNEVTVHWNLAKRGVVLWQQPELVVRQDRGKLHLRDLLRERFDWGRLFAATRVRAIPLQTRIQYILCSPGLPLLLIGRIGWKVFHNRRNCTQFLLSIPGMVVLAAAWGLGELAGYVTGRDR